MSRHSYLQLWWPWGLIWRAAGLSLVKDRSTQEKLRSQLKWFGSQARMPPRFYWDYNHLYFKLHCNTKLHSHCWIEGIFPLNKVKLRSSPFSVSVLPWCTRLSLSFDLGQAYTSIIRDFSYLFQYAGYNNQWWEKWRYFFQ